MSLRFSSIEELAGTMGKSVEDVKKRVLKDTGTNGVANGQGVSPEHSKLNFSPLPSDIPQVILFRRLVHNFGLFMSGGELVYELKNIVSGRRYEADMALPRYKVAIEMDGWRSHGLSKNGFKRDREKWLLFAKHGWLVLPISREQIINQLEDVVELIEECVYQRPKFPVQIDYKASLIGAVYKGDL